MSVRALNRADGKKAYEVRWREGDRNRSRRFHLRGDADAFNREVARRRQLGVLAVSQLTVKGPTLNSWIADRWGPEHAANLAPKTRTGYAVVYQAHIEPWLGHLPMQELTVGRLREWQADRLRHGITPNTIHNCRTVLSSVLRHAAESEAIAGNPLTNVRPAKAAQRDQVIPLAPATVERLRSYLSLRDATIVSVLAYAGLRPSELRALRWGDVQTTISVQRAANPDGTIKHVKTAKGVRNVRVLAPLADDLAAWRAERGGRAGDLVFPAQHGATITETGWGNWREDVWAPVWTMLDLADYGLLKRPRPYDMRHSFASLLLAEGRTVHYVAEQLGHAATLTLNTYGHLIAEYAERHDIVAADEITNARATTTRPERAAPLPAAPGTGVKSWISQQQLDALDLLKQTTGPGVMTFSAGIREQAGQAHISFRTARALERRGLVRIEPLGAPRDFAIHLTKESA